MSHDMSLHTQTGVTKMNSNNLQIQSPEQPTAEMSSLDEIAKAAGLKRVSAYVPDPNSPVVSKKAEAKRKERAARAAAGARTLTIEGVPDDLRPYVIEAARAAMAIDGPQQPPPQSIPGPMTGRAPLIQIALATSAGMAVGFLIGFIVVGG
jgi:hypothetical protein